MKLNWWQKIENGDFPRGPEYVSKRKARGPKGDVVKTGVPSGNALQRRVARRRKVGA
jgi:hypothetical protein